MAATKAVLSCGMVVVAALGSAILASASDCIDESGESGPCMPGREFCGKPFPKDTSPAFHLMDQHGCGENDPNGPVFDPVHGVFHHFYQIHLSAPISYYLDGTVASSGHGPDYGHFVSKVSASQECSPSLCSRPLAQRVAVVTAFAIAVGLHSLGSPPDCHLERLRRVNHSLDRNQV
jgi:hypothetical protein